MIQSFHQKIAEVWQEEEGRLFIVLDATLVSILREEDSLGIVD